MSRRILLVEDDADLALITGRHLRDCADEVRTVASGDAALDLAQREPFDLVVLDLMLPGIDGIEVCRRLRARENYVPILMLTARSSELDRVAGLEVGADDYLTKPFSIPELVARVRALFRRVDNLRAAHTAAGDGQSLRAGDVTVDLVRRTVTVGDRPVALTAREFELLVHFARHPGHVFTRAQLLDTVWGYGHDGYEHTVNSHINRLRAKIERDPAIPELVITVWGVGYKLADPPAA